MLARPELVLLYFQRDLSGDNLVTVAYEYTDAAIARAMNSVRSHETKVTPETVRNMVTGVYLLSMSEKLSTPYELSQAHEIERSKTELRDLDDDFFDLMATQEYVSRATFLHLLVMVYEYVTLFTWDDIETAKMLLDCARKGGMEEEWLEEVEKLDWSEDILEIILESVLAGESNRAAVTYSFAPLNKQYASPWRSTELNRLALIQDKVTANGGSIGVRQPVGDQYGTSVAKPIIGEPDESGQTDDESRWPRATEEATNAPPQSTPDAAQKVALSTEEKLTRKEDKKKRVAEYTPEEKQKAREEARTRRRREKRQSMAEAAHQSAQVDSVAE